mgnify:FL=1
MNRIDLNILEKKAAELFFENKKKTYNIKQIKFFLNVKIDTIYIKDLLRNLFLKKCINIDEQDKYSFNKSSVFLVGTIGKRKNKLIDLVSSDEIEISRKESAGFFENDQVYYFINKKGKVKILSVKKRTDQKFVGEVEKNNNIKSVFIRKQNVRFIINDKQAKKEDLVVVRLKDWKYEDPEGEVLKVIGKASDSEAQTHAILEEFSLPYVFSDKVEQETNNIKKEGELEKYREDHSTKLTFTIDPDDAKDFDDALSFEKLDDSSMEVGVHIADVSHYVKTKTELDKEAFYRATSVYLADRVVPMLPEKLSNDLCSLNPREKKNVFSVFFIFSRNHKISNIRFCKSLIISDERFSYEEAQYIIENKEKNIPAEKTILGKEKKVNKKLFDSIKELYSISKSLKREREEKGSIFFNKEEIRFIVNEKGSPTGYKIKKQKEANFLIEEFMLLANKAVATKIKENTRSGVYRVHDLPDEKKLVEIERFVKNIGYNNKLVNAQNTNKEINALLKACEGKPEKNVIDMMVIRAMSKAKYSSQNIGHFGLKFENYSHFTSPIRRYPDLMVHRILFSILKKEKYYDREIEDKCFHCSQREELATKAERASTKLMQVKYMSKRLNEKFSGIVSGISERGVFVEVISNKCEGFVRMKDIPYDFFVYNYKTNSLIGQNTKEEYCLGDKVLIRVEKTNLEKKHIDFKILSKSE